MVIEICLTLIQVRYWKKYGLVSVSNPGYRYRHQNRKFQTIPSPSFGRTLDLCPRPHKKSLNSPPYLPRGSFLLKGATSPDLLLINGFMRYYKALSLKWPGFLSGSPPENLLQNLVTLLKTNRHFDFDNTFFVRCFVLLCHVLRCLILDWFVSFSSVCPQCSLCVSLMFSSSWEAPIQCGWVHGPEGWMGCSWSPQNLITTIGNADLKMFKVRVGKVNKEIGWQTPNYISLCTYKFTLSSAASLHL